MIEEAIMSYTKEDDVILVKEMKFTRSSIHDIQSIEEKKMKC